MQNRKRLTNILIAGTLTGLVLVVFLAFRGGETAVAETDVTGQTAVIEMVAADSTDSAALQAQIEALQAQNEELRAAIETMQARETEYQNQIEAANQTINELSAQGGSLALGPEGFEQFGEGFRPHEHNH